MNVVIVIMSHGLGKRVSFVVDKRRREFLSKWRLLVVFDGGILLWVLDLAWFGLFEDIELTDLGVG